jgi:hypothetical protein
VLQRGEMEKPPVNNDRGWRTETTIFTPHGKTTIFLTAWEWPDGRPCEVFISSSRSGSEVDKFVQEFGKMVSRLLQAGVPVQTVIGKLKGEHGPLAGTTNRPEAPAPLGIQDLVGILLEKRYVREPGPPAEELV